MRAAVNRAVWTAVLLLPASACAPERRTALDLVEAFAEAELRGDELDLATLAADPSFERRGWSGLEGPAGRRTVWAQGPRSRLRLPFQSTGDKELHLRVRSHESLGPSLRLSLTLNDAPLAQIVVSPAEQDIRVVIPSSAQKPGDNVLEITAPRYAPAPDDPDRRALTAAFSALSVRPVGAAARGGMPVVDGDRLVLPPLSSAAYYLRVPADARLSLEARGDETGKGRILAVVEDDASRNVVLDAAAPARSGAALDVGLEASAGAIVRLELANPAADGVVRVTAARLTVAPGVESEPPPPAPAAAARPNIVLYVVDTLRADYLGAYGHAAPTSPRLDAFAREAVLFEDGWAQAAWTRPAVASLFTGLHVGSHGLDREDRVLREEAETLAEALRAAGYRTGAFVANHLLGGRFGFRQGFDAWNPGSQTLYGAPASDLAREALAWVDGSRPFFLYVHTMEPHAPYTPSDDDLAPFAGEAYEGTTDTRALLRLGQLGTLAPAGLGFLRSRYQGEVHQNDRGFGDLLDGLRARGLADGTAVVFTADHGEEFLEHGGTEHGKTLYQELVRVPLVVRMPGGTPGGRRETAPAEQIDLMPTILGLAGVQPPRGLPGRDLRSRLTGSPGPATSSPVLFSEERFAVVDKVAARAGDLKLIFNNDGPALWRAKAHLELYDLARDPLERTNLAASRPIAVAFLQRQVDAFRKAQARGVAPRIALSPEEREQLRALGYVQ